MQDIGYLIGVLCAIGSGIVNNLGTVYQKKVVNGLPEGEKIGRNLLKSPLWLFGLFLQFVLGTIFFLLAYGLFIPEWGIGAALVPGLMAIGLVILTIGAIKILNERITKQDLIGIGLMIGAITLLGFSALETEVTKADLENGGFVLRVIIFTIVLVGISVFCQIFQNRSMKYKGILLAVFSGCMLTISNFWVAPLVKMLEFVFGGQFIIFFVIAAIILVLTNFLALYKLQQAFQHGQAANLIPIQQVPIQIGPIFIYLAVFIAIPPKVYSLPFMLVGVCLIIVSSFLLARHQARLEEIK
jgi:hypothetical protein